MKIVIFGASGRTGKPMLERALAAGHEVTAFVRNPSNIATTHERLRVMAGDVLDQQAVAEAIKGQDAVLLVLGHTKSSPKDILTRGTEHVLAAMKQHGVRRLINITGAGVADPNDQPRLFNKFMSFLLKRLAADLLADSERQTRMIRESGLDWTIVRVPVLNDNPPSGNVRAGYVGNGTGARIARADVADFMLRQLDDASYLHKAPMISN
jgi:putative NADH-flavin reductase